ncbi:MAG: hypothetical protein WBH16_05285, partial [Candidatus Nanopelagicales bacterium]
MVRRSRAAGIMAAFAAGTLLLGACSSDSEETTTDEANASGTAGLRIAAVIKDEANPFFGTIAEGMRDAASEYGVDLTVEYAP